MENPSPGLEAGIVVLFRVAKLFGHLRLQPLGVEFVRKVVVFVDGLAEPRLRLFELLALFSGVGSRLNTSQAASRALNDACSSSLLRRRRALRSGPCGLSNQP